MNALLCAVMIGTSCVAWHPKGTKKGDIESYGKYQIENRYGNRYEVWFDRNYESKLKRMCKHGETAFSAVKKHEDKEARGPIIDITTMRPPEAHFSCRKVDADNWTGWESDKGPLERQHEQAAKAKKEKVIVPMTYFPNPNGGGPVPLCVVDKECGK